MASSYMLRPLCTSHLFYPSPSSQDRVCCTGVRRRRRSGCPVFVLRCRRDLGLWSNCSPLSVKLTASSARINKVVLPQGNLTGQVNIVANVEIDAKVSNSQFVDIQLLSDESSAPANGGVPLGPAPDPGPEFDYQVYAMNTMVGYEPPPPPRIPFGGPFEDYYDEYVGVDYVPKQEKPTSSFLMFLDSLNEKRAEEEAKLREKDPSRPVFDPKPNKNLFAGSKPLFTIARPTHPAPLPREYTPPSLDPSETPPRRTFSSGSWSGGGGRQATERKPVGDGIVYEIPTSVILPIDLQDVPSKLAGKPSPILHQSGVVEEFSPTSQAGTTLNNTSPEPSSSNEIKLPLSPQTPAATTAFSSPPQTESSVEIKASSSPATLPSRLAEEPTFGGRPLSPSLRPAGGNDASGTSTRPLEAPSNRPPLPQTMPSGSNQYVSPQGRPSEDINGSGRPLFPQTRPVEASSFVPQGRPLNEPFASGRSPPQSVPLDMNRDDQRVPPQIDGMVQPPVSGQVAASDAPVVAPTNTEFYEPMEGDIVLGVVIYANEDEVGLEIGGRVPALMTMREFQPLAEIGDNSFFKIPLGDGSNETLEGFVAPPIGKVMLVEDKAANDGIYRGENVNIGTIVIAAVQSRDLIDGRPVVTCRRLAKSLAFVRIEQLMRTGEAIQLEITQCNDGGLQGYLEGVRAFLPRSELLRRPENSAALQEYVGKTLTIAILQAEEYASNVIISEVKPWMSKNLLLGSVHHLTVTRIYPYGLQVEVENTRVRGFIHISNITRGYVTSLSTSFVEGEKIKAMVIRGRKPGQLSFSIEALEPPSDEGVVLRDKEQVFYGAEEIAKSSEEFQLPLEERRIFVMPYASTSVNVRDSIANLPWLQLEQLKSSS